MKLTAPKNCCVCGVQLVTLLAKRDAEMEALKQQVSELSALVRQNTARPPLPQRDASPPSTNHYMRSSAAHAAVRCAVRRESSCGLRSPSRPRGSLGRGWLGGWVVRAGQAAGPPARVARDACRSARVGARGWTDRDAVRPIMRFRSEKTASETSFNPGFSKPVSSNYPLPPSVHGTYLEPEVRRGTTVSASRKSPILLRAQSRLP